MNYFEICERLQAAGIADAESEAGLLLSHFCGVRPYELPFRKGQQFESEALERAIVRRLSREPLQYLLGEWEFFGMKFAVSPACLIPRPDTELLVEQAIERMPKGARFADFCTGSGCIAAAVLANRPDTTCVAVDAFDDTLEIARRNLEANGVGDRAELVLLDLLQPLAGAFDEKFDCILSNPPYIPTAEVAGLAPELAHEPEAALDGGADGMRFYRHFLSQSRHLLSKGGFWIFEIGYDQKRAICDLAAGEGFACRVLHDLGGNARVAVVTKIE